MQALTIKRGEPVLIAFTPVCLLAGVAIPVILYQWNWIELILRDFFRLS